MFSEISATTISPRSLKHRKARVEQLSVEETGGMLRVVRNHRSVVHQVFANHAKALTNRCSSMRMTI